MRPNFDSLIMSCSEAMLLASVPAIFCVRSEPFSGSATHSGVLARARISTFSTLVHNALSSAVQTRCSTEYTSLLQAPISMF